MFIVLGAAQKELALNFPETFVHEQNDLIVKESLSLSYLGNIQECLTNTMFGICEAQQF